MKTNSLSTKSIGSLLLLAAIALLVPYTILSIIFDYPNILRQDTATVLTRFHTGGNSLIWTWFAFAITGLPLIPAFIFIGQYLEKRAPVMRFATTIGVLSLIVQMIGLLRWTFVVPILANDFVNASDAATKASAIMAFKLIHQFGGVILGEHLGQLFTVIWTLLICMMFLKLKLFPKWLSYFGIVSAGIYLFAQAELFATVMPSVPVWELAGFLGSTMWLIWLMLVGVQFIKNKNLLNS